MEWIKIFGLLTFVLSLFGLYQLYRIVKEFKKLDRSDPLQRVPDEFARKLSKRLIIIYVIGMLGSIYGIASAFFR
jgi:hypothetical protein